MKARWLVMTLLLHSAMPALAQLENDPENAQPAHDETPQLPRHVIPPSQVNAQTAAVSPTGGTANAKKPETKSTCSVTNPCAEATPAAR